MLRQIESIAYVNSSVYLLMISEVILLINPFNTSSVPKHITLWAMKGCFFLELIQLGHLN